MVFLSKDQPTVKDTSASSEHFEKTVVHLLVNINRTLGEIHDTLKRPNKELEDQDIEDMAVHYLFQVGPNLSEITRKLSGQGINVRRQSLTEAKKFARFQEKLEIFRNGEIRRGHMTEDGDVEAHD